MEQIQENQIEEGEEVSEKGQSSQFIIPKCSARKQLCDVCEAALYKYTCPRCKTKSCGVACLNKHKKNHSCSGVADAFVNLTSKNIQERQVQKDYIYVKEMMSNADKVKRTLTGVQTLNQQPKRFKIMRLNAKRQYNINLLNAPAIIERHRENISFYFVKTKTFYWVIQILFWRFSQGKQKCSKVITQPTADSKTIQEILPQAFLCKDLLLDGINTQKKEEFKVYLQRKIRNSAEKQAVQLDHQSELRNCLQNQTIYQFPTLIAVHQTLTSTYLSLRKTKQTPILS